MTGTPKSIALAAALIAHSVFVGVGPASAMQNSLADLRFPNAETRWGCYFFGTCERLQTVTKQQSNATSGFAAPKLSPGVSTKGDR
ncbi:MAG: hypothetical protein AAGA15_04095 [Pseudomonadota bacterium]